MSGILVTSSVIRREDLPAPTVIVEGLEITPVARVYQVGLPGKRWGVIWGKPKMVILKTSAGSYLTLKISDRTRGFQICLVMFSLLTVAAAWLFLRKRKDISKVES